MKHIGNWDWKNRALMVFFSLGYAWSPFRNFQRYLRNVVGLNEDDIQLMSKQHSSSFVTYEFLPDIYTIKDIAEAVSTIGDHERTPKIEYDYISIKTKRTLIHFGAILGTLRFDEKSFLKT